MLTTHITALPGHAHEIEDGHVSKHRARALALFSLPTEDKERRANSCGGMIRAGRWPFAQRDTRLKPSERLGIEDMWIEREIDELALPLVLRAAHHEQVFFNEQRRVAATCLGLVARSAQHRPAACHAGWGGSLCRTRVRKERRKRESGCCVLCLPDHSLPLAFPPPSSLPPASLSPCPSLLPLYHSPPLALAL
eukprot:scaffold126802_cov31-Tisochrysis_lutea.AAC.1